jgi:hypothetical protein
MMNVSVLLTIAALSPTERVASPFALPLPTALSEAKGLRVNSAKGLRVNSASRVRDLSFHHSAFIE